MLDRRVSRLKNDFCNTAKQIRRSVKQCKKSKMPNGYNRTNGGEGGIHKSRIISLNKEVGVVGKNSIGQILRKRREELSLTQRQVANHVGVTEAAVSRWESGEIANMRRDKIVNLADILKVSPILIMGAEEFDGKPPTLTFEQASLLNDFDSMSQERQTMTLQLVKSLRIAHPKEKLSSDNTFNNNGEIKNNFVSYGGRNSVNQNVTVGERQ